MRTIETLLPSCTGMGILQWTYANVPMSAYERRIDTILALIAELSGQRRALARAWGEKRARPAYLDYFGGNGALNCALDQLPAVTRRSVAKATGEAILTMAFARQAQRRIRKRLRPAPVESRA